MKIIGCDFHPSFQQIAMVDTETGEYTERRLTPDEARRFYAELQGPVLVGMEACGNTLWFERLLASLGVELWLGDAGKIRAMEVRKQKTDRRDAQWLLQLLLENRFPRVWVPTPEQRDTRQLLLHRHKLVGMRRQVKNELQHLALNQGVQQKRKLWSAAGRQRLEELPLTGWTAQRREDSLELLDELNRPHCQARCGGATGSEQRCGGALVADASGSGSDHGVGVFADAGRDRALRAQPPGGQLSGVESGGAFQRRAAAAGRRSASRAIPAAQFVGGSGTERGALGSRVEACLPKAEAQETFWRRQGDGGAQTGGAVVLDVEDAAAVCRRSHAGQPGSFLGSWLRPAA